MKLYKLGLIGVFVGGLLAGCGNAESAIKDVEVEPKENKTVEIEAVDEDKVEHNIPYNVKEWIAEAAEDYHRPGEADQDEGYDYYLKAKAVSNMAVLYNQAEGQGIEKDFENLQALASIIKHEQFVRTAYIDPHGNAMEQLDAVNDWKPVSKRTTISFDYMKQLINDIDVAINKDDAGETYGVSHELDGAKVEEMESFMEYFDEDDE